jgi:hypothetical protein
MIGPKISKKRETCQSLENVFNEKHIGQCCKNLFLFFLFARFLFGIVFFPFYYSPFFFLKKKEAIFLYKFQSNPVIQGRHYYRARKWLMMMVSTEAHINLNGNWLAQVLWRPYYKQMYHAYQ